MAEVKRQFHGASLNITEAGTFTNDEGKEISFNKGIKLHVGTNYIKLSAIQLAGLLAACRDPEVKEELQARFLEEKAELESLGGF